ncbi:MAG: hypothetical protein WCT31_01510, partial [Candidatus Micrarchaeia archaeon]
QMYWTVGDWMKMPNSNLEIQYNGNSSFTIWPSIVKLGEGEMAAFGSPNNVGVKIKEITETVGVGPNCTISNKKASLNFGWIPEPTTAYTLAEGETANWGSYSVTATGITMTATPSRGPNAGTCVISNEKATLSVKRV